DQRAPRPSSPGNTARRPPPIAVSPRPRWRADLRGDRNAEVDRWLAVIELGHSALLPVAIRIARHTLSAVAGMATSVTPSGASASTIAFITVGVAATVPPSPTPLMPSGLDLLGTGLKSTAMSGIVSARGIA